MNSQKDKKQLWQTLQQQAQRLNQPRFHLREMLKDEKRLARFSRKGGGLFFDFSRQRVDAEVLNQLIDLASASRVKEGFADMLAGRKVNTTENRAALHSCARSFETTPLMVDGMNVRAEMGRIRQEVAQFSEDVRTHKLVGATGKPFKDIVVIGIGGSYLGTEFVSTALQSYATGGLRLHFLSNVDIHNFAHITAQIDPARTLWIVISKSYTTAETMANAAQAVAFMRSKDLDPSAHMVAVTSKGSPGDAPGQGMLRVFHMFDFIGGRYSVTSAVGGLPLSLILGFDLFEQFLKGAQEMDLHAAQAPEADNLPLLAALLSVWNTTFLGYPAQAIIPYASPLRKLAAHVQQLNMESNGKSVSTSGTPLASPAGVIIFGEPGTNAQHSFFQLAHQGPAFPIDFIGVVRPQPFARHFGGVSRGVTNHQELFANMMAQASALALGRDHEQAGRRFDGNRPSSTFLLEELSPHDIGCLLAFYEAKTVFEAILWDINPFDQFGVELGKVLAGDIRRKMEAHNQGDTTLFSDDDPIVRFYLQALLDTE